MRKVVLFALCATMFVACNKKELERSNQQKDSLAQVVASKDAELDELMGTFNDIQEGFRQINEAEGRVDLAKGAEGNNKAKISENIKFIAEKMEQNRKELNEQLPVYSRISQIILHEEEFAKTPKKSIKRYLYQN